MIEENKDICKKFFNSINSKDYEQAFGLFDESLEWHIMGTANVSGIYDKRKISLGFKGLGRSFEGFIFSLSEITAEENRVSIVAESKATHKSNRKNYNNHYHFLFTLDKGKIILVKEFFDTIHANWVELPN